MNAADKKHLVFIGMPGSGKTTVSKLVAEVFRKPWFDSDIEIEAAEGMSIAEIFSQKGEEYFRRAESSCIEGLMNGVPAVIAVGGGAVLRNGGLLKQNAIVIYLSRSLDNISKTLQTGTRPLLKDRDSLERLYGERREIYESLCDYRVENEGEIGETLKKVLEVLP